jgi:hypothetical protein
MLVYHNHLSGFERQPRARLTRCCANDTAGRKEQREGTLCTVQRIRNVNLSIRRFPGYIGRIGLGRCFQNMRRHHIVPSAIDYFDIYPFHDQQTLADSVARDTRDGGYENLKDIEQKKIVKLQPVVELSQGNNANVLPRSPTCFHPFRRVRSF